MSPAKNLFFLITLLLLLALTTGQARATYADYIGAGHDSGVCGVTCVNDDTATGQRTSGLSGANHDIAWNHGWLGPEGDSNPNPTRSSYDRWPTSPDGTIQALDRVKEGNYANDVTNWTAAPTPGS
jgi:hypothetical protein